MNRITSLFLGIATESWVRYALTAGIAWLLASVFFKKRWQHRKIIPRNPLPSDLRREIFWSSITALIYGLVGTTTILIGRNGSWKLYRRIDDHGWLWFATSIVLAILIHDTWFYWTHRLMHHRWLFKWVHRIHHQSTNPSPWAAYSFSPLEAATQACIFPILMFSIPMHPIAYAVFMTWQIVNNVIGHTGYEYFPNRLMNSWLGRFLNTPTNHIQHHEKPRGNFGLYFNYWDRLMNTNHPDYEQRFRSVTSRPKSPP